MTQNGSHPPADESSLPIVVRPDGFFYWRDEETHQEHGPFATVQEALEDMETGGEEWLDPSETLMEVEAEIGIADWLDPDTGEPAEEARAKIADDH